MKRLQLQLVFGVAAFSALFLSGTTAVASSADFNNDNCVDNLDLVKWNADYGSVSTPGGNDFLAWQAEAGNASNQVAEGAANPEPATIVVWGTLAAVTSLGIVARRRRELASAHNS